MNPLIQRAMVMNYGCASMHSLVAVAGLSLAPNAPAETLLERGTHLMHQLWPVGTATRLKGRMVNYLGWNWPVWLI